MFKRGARRRTLKTGEDGTYGGFMGRLGENALETPEANPDTVGMAEHTPTAAEEITRLLLDSPTFRVRTLSALQAAVFMGFVDGLSQRTMAAKFNRTPKEVRQAINGLRGVVQTLAARAAAGLKIGGADELSAKAARKTSP